MKCQLLDLVVGKSPMPAADQIYNAIKTGYRLFDGAEDYGNEKRLVKESIVPSKTD